MTNQQKLKSLKDYELSQVISALKMHVESIQYQNGSFDYLDAFDLHDEELEIIISWLNQKYDPKVGFKFKECEGKDFYLTKDKLYNYSYLENSGTDFEDEDF